MKEMLAFLRRQKVQHVVIIDDISRLARDIEIHRKFRRLIDDAGGKLESPSFRFGTSSHERFAESVAALNAEYMRIQNSEQVINRMIGRMLRGYYVLSAPVGYKYVGPAKKSKDLVPDEPVASLVKEALEGFASGRFATQAEVHRFLESRPEFPRDATGKIHNERVRELLTRIVYAGYIEVPNWNIPRTKAKHEPLISYQTYEKIQKLMAGNKRAAARKDFNEDFPLRGFVCCADCDQPLRAAWTKGRSTHYAYYVCHTKECASYGKSIKRDRIEGEFERDVLSTLKPTKELFHALYVVMKHLWNERVAGVQAGINAMRQEIENLEKQAEKLIDMSLQTTSDDMLTRFQNRLRLIENQKVSVREKIERYGKPRRGFDDCYRTAMRFLENPANFWVSGHFCDKNTLLRLAFPEKVQYSRISGYRTAAKASPFRLFDTLAVAGGEMVDATGIEPVTLRV